jgi:aryl-alcohol dehydrogenase-like predicted oxidoreductase
METRTLGKTGVQVSALGFGCGATGGILIKGSRAEGVQAVQRAIDLGVNYFDTAPLYGDGQSETNLGAVLQAVKGEVLVGTKVRLREEQLGKLEQAVVASVETSLKRLHRECLDLIQVHNYVVQTRNLARQWLTVDDVAAMVEVFRKLREQGKVRYWGINGLGDPAAIRAAIAGDVHTAQVCFNLLNPSAGVPVPGRFPFPDYEQVIDQAARHDVGIIAIRVLAGGALSGTANRHANASREVDTIATHQDFADDVALAQRFAFLVEEGYASSLVEAAIRFVAGRRGVSTTVIGISTLAQLEEAVVAVNKGPLPPEAVARLGSVWAGMAAV